ncbi:MAG: M20/M25/M40 family metallo-hydrolase [Bacteroidetes bacterium]|nr:M20/M25/M40 family metallo-hydrolase [Bacteroidota bacterium]
MMRRLGLLAGGILAMLLAVLFVNTLRFESKQIEARPITSFALDTTAAAERLAGALRFETITQRDPAALDSSAYRQLAAYLARTFPRVHETLRIDTVSGLSRLYTWSGRDTSLAPLVIMGHTDVVPVEAGTDTAWTHPPFSGQVADGYVWGRGALDDKASVVGALEAVEELLRAGHQPERTVHLAFGHDEEVGGARGAKRLAARIAAQGPRPGLVVDEGGAITIGAVPGVEQPVALVGVAEKGYLSIELVATSAGGHSAMPPPRTSVGVVSEAVTRLEANPLPADLDGVTGQTFAYVAPEMGWGGQAAFANLWLLEPAVEWALSRDPTANAAIRTTTAPTVIEGGVKDNVIPTRARAVVNFRVLPSQGIETVMDHIRTVLDGVPVDIRTLQNSAPPPVAAIDSAPFRQVQRAIQQVTPDPVIVAPLLVPGATDARHYAPYSDHVYRFLPFRLTPADRGRIHGTDERIALSDYAAIVAYFTRLIEGKDAADA